MDLLLLFLLCVPSITAIHRNFHPASRAHCNLISKFVMTCECTNSQVPDILKNLTLNIKSLTMKLRNTWDGEPNSLNMTVDLRTLSIFKELEYFRLYSDSGDVYQYFNHPLLFESDTLENLTKLGELHLNVATKSPLVDVIRHLTALETLDLSLTENLVFKNVTAMLRALNSTALKVLLLSNIQTIGSEGFSNELNISAVFTTQTFLMLEELDLSRNTFGVIYPSILDKLPNLKRLDVSFNYLVALDANPLMVEMAVHPKLEIFSMSNQGKPMYYREELSAVTSTKSIMSRHRDNNPVSNSNLTSTVLACTNTIGKGNISLLINDYELICDVFRCISQHSLLGVSCKAYKNVKENIDISCPYFIRFPFFQNLKELRLDHLNWYTRYSYNIHRKLCLNENSIKIVSFANNGDWIHKFHLVDGGNETNYSFVFSKIESVNLSRNNFHIKDKAVFPQLKEYDLSGNVISVQNDSFCSVWPSIRKLILSSTRISYTHKDWFGGCFVLEYLDLQNNQINLTDTGLALSDSVQLQVLLLDNNNIDVLPQSFTNQLDMIVEHQLRNNFSFRLEVTFTGNPLSCICSDAVLHTIDWFQKTRVDIPNKESYWCFGSQGKMFLYRIILKEFQHNCFPSYKLLIIETSLSTLSIVLVIITLLLIHRYRWRLSYNIQKTLSCLFRYKNRQPRDVDEDTNVISKYDAFVSYCSDDRFWVHDCLMKTLESDQFGFKLCIHYRDFIIGEDISSEIIRSINQSRKLIIVLSETSLKRPWCQFELQYALTEAVKRRMKLAIIKLGPLDSIDDITVASILDNNVILQWHENEDAQKVFWMKLREYMCDNMDTFPCFCCPMGKRHLSVQQVNAYSEEASDTTPLLVNT